MSCHCTWMSRWKLGSKVSNWVITTIYPIYLPFAVGVSSRDKDGCTPNVRVPMVFSWCSLGILGEYNP